jgi:hypothetical protein
MGGDCNYYGETNNSANKTVVSIYGRIPENIFLKHQIQGCGIDHFFPEKIQIHFF